jgi:hypothetical protein
MHKRGRSREDFLLWGAELSRQAGLTAPGTLAIVLWQHELWCAMHPCKRPTAAGRCHCKPDGDAFVNPYCPDEYRVALVRDGRALPVERPAG